MTLPAQHVPDQASEPLARRDTTPPTAATPGRQPRLRELLRTLDFERGAALLRVPPGGLPRSTAETPQSTAETPQSTAETPRSTAETATAASQREGGRLVSGALESGVPERALPARRDFQRMWQEHPQNHQSDPAENLSSEAILADLGFPSGWHTCAIRLSMMLNGMGLRITPARAKAAGLTRRPRYSRRTRQYYILSAREMWRYLDKNFRRADAIYPQRGRFRDAATFYAAFEATIRPIVQSRKGIVAFDKLLTGYTGTGHVDLFDGQRLSNAPVWYPCRRLRLWYV